MGDKRNRPPNGRKRGRKLSEREVAERRAAVEAVVFSGRWSGATCLELSERWAVTTRQIHRDREAVIEAARRDHQAAVERRPVYLEELRRYRSELALVSLSGDARAAADVVRLFALEAEVMGLSEPAAVDVSISVDTADPVALARELIEGLPFALEVLGMEAAELKPLQLEGANDGS